MNPKSVLFIFIGLLLLASFPSMLPKLAVATGFADVSVSEANAMINEKPFLVLLDVRNQSEYDAGHIRNARLIPVWQLTTRLNELKTSDEILVYCQAGGRSANASQTLADKNFTHVYNMLGGITSWIAARHPLYIKYLSIQAAINNATDGDIVYVSSGFYNEYLSVNKSITLVGENVNTTTINGTTTVINVNSDNVSINDFTIQYSGCACFGYSAINITREENVNVTDNVITSDDFAIYVGEAQEVTVSRNTITHTGDACIVVMSSSRTTVFDNDITASDGIEVDNSTQSKFLHNIILSGRGAGIFSSDSCGNTFSSNSVVSNSSAGLSISTSNNNTFFDNTICSSNTYGLFFWQSNNNSFFHNTFLGSTGNVSGYGSNNLWDNGFEGNFWSNYTGADISRDGIGDTPYVIDSTNKDNYPLMGKFSSFNTSLNYDVNIVSNSTINELQYLEPNSTIELQVSNTTADQKIGFCRISIPHNLMNPNNGEIAVVIDNGQTPVSFLNNTLYDNGTHRWIYFTYPQSTHKILIVPELPTWLLLPLFIMTTFVVVRAKRKKRHDLFSTFSLEPNH